MQICNKDLFRYFNSFVILQIIVLVLSGCTSQCGYVRTSVIDLDLTSGEISLVSPSASPGDNFLPSFKVTGVKEGSRVAIFSDANCQSEIGALVAGGNEVTVPVSVSLTEGTYSITSRTTREDADPSPCSSVFTYVIDTQPPTITNVYPDLVSTTGTTILTVNGSHFVSDMTVNIANIRCQSVIMVDSSTLICSAPPMNEIDADLIVNKQSGSNGTLSAAVHYVVGLPSAPLCFDGSVNAIAAETNSAASNRRVFLGGDFGQVGQCSGGVAPISKDTGILNPGIGAFAAVDGYVNVIISDGSGGFYLGGKFNRVGGVSKINVAHILSDYNIDQSFGSAITSMDGEVKTLVLVSGRLFLGGDFTLINGVSHKNLAELDFNGNLSSWDAQISDVSPPSVVTSLLAVNSKLYVAGKFSKVSNINHGNLCSFTLATTPSLDTAWLPSTNNRINAMLNIGSNMYLAGAFTQLSTNTGTFTLNRLSSVNLTNGLVNSAWNPNANGEVMAMAASNTDIVAVGKFSSLGGSSHIGVGQIGTDVNASVANWGPTIGSVSDSEFFNSIAIDTDQIYLGGLFTSISGVSRFNLAAVQRSTGLLNSAWNPKANNKVNALIIANGVVYAGGDFTAVGSRTVSHLAAFSEVTGNAVDFNFSVDGPVNSLFFSGSSLYVGGKFGKIGKSPRNSIAEISLNNAGDVLTAWDPSLNLGVSFGTASATVNGISVHAGNQVIVGGEFSHAGRGASLTSVSLNIAAFGGSNGPNGGAGGAYVSGSFGGGGVGVDGPVYALSKSGNTLIVSGEFLKVEGANHRGFAAYTISGSTISLTGASPLAGSSSAADSDFGPGNSIYLCGARVGSGTDCGYINDYGSGSPTLTDWGPTLISGESIATVLSYASTGRIFIGGKFSKSGAENLMAFSDSLSPPVATTPSWAGKFYSRQKTSGVKILSQSADETMLYVGGGFDLVNDKSRSGFVRYILSTMQLSDP